MCRGPYAEASWEVGSLVIANVRGVGIPWITGSTLAFLVVLAVAIPTTAVLLAGAGEDPVGRTLAEELPARAAAAEDDGAAGREAATSWRGVASVDSASSMSI